MKVSDSAYKKIQGYEGLRLTAYKCPSGVWTIGYGQTGKVDGKPITKGMTITKAKAESLFKETISKFEASLKKVVPSSVNNNQWDALLSFAYNCGISNLKSSTLLKKVKADKDDESIRAEFLRWNKGGGKVIAGLTKRREWEANRYFGKE